MIQKPIFLTGLQSFKTLEMPIRHHYLLVLDNMIWILKIKLIFLKRIMNKNLKNKASYHRIRHSITVSIMANISKTFIDYIMY